MIIMIHLVRELPAAEAILIRTEKSPKIDNEQDDLIEDGFEFVGKYNVELIDGMNELPDSLLDYKE